MKLYRGSIDSRGERKVEVVENGKSRQLDARLDIRNHSPTGLAWGYSGSGPAQLALALLADALQDDGRAERLYQTFKFCTIATLPQDSGWEMDASLVVKQAKRIEDATVIS